MALTLATIRTRVKARYERNTSSNDVRASLLDAFINDALREIYNTLGDNAYFLRKTQSVTVSQYPAVTTMPSNVKRLYRLEDEGVAPGYPIDWTFVRHDSSGNMVIVTRCSGTFTAHYLEYPVDLVADGDTAAVPTEHGELVVVLACRRLAESVGNFQLAQLLAAEMEGLVRSLKRDCLRFGGQRHEALQSIWNTAVPGPWSSGQWW